MRKRVISALDVMGRCIALMAYYRTSCWLPGYGRVNPDPAVPWHMAAPEADATEVEQAAERGAPSLDRAWQIRSMG